MNNVMDLLNRYYLYLYILGYKISSIDDKHCSITDYINGVERIAALEKKSIEDLAKDIENLYSQYEVNGEKHHSLPQDNNRTLNGLKHFKEFVSLCNKK